MFGGGTSRSVDPRSSFLVLFFPFASTDVRLFRFSDLDLAPQPKSSNHSRLKLNSDDERAFPSSQTHVSNESFPSCDVRPLPYHSPFFFFLLTDRPSSFPRQPPTSLRRSRTLALPFLNLHQTRRRTREKPGVLPWIECGWDDGVEGRVVGEVVDSENFDGSFVWL